MDTLITVSMLYMCFACVVNAIANIRLLKRVATLEYLVRHLLEEQDDHR